jgi:hypothetical protein
MPTISAAANAAVSIVTIIATRHQHCQKVYFCLAAGAAAAAAAAADTLPCFRTSS